MIRKVFLTASTFVLVCGLAACSSSGGAGPDGGDGPNGPDSGAGADADHTGFTSIISRSWEIPPGQEFYRCTAVTVEEDIYISTFRALSPLGTHHTVLSLSDSPVRADGDYDCGAGSLQHHMLYSSGVGTPDLDLPTGVAIKVSAGQQLHLNLHLYNVSDQTITGTSGSLVKTLDAGEVQHEAEMVFGGTTAVYLPPSSPPEPRDIVGGCRFTQDAKLVAHWPHMHKLGIHMKLVHQATSGDVVIHDAPYDFEEQIYYPIEPLEVAANERIEVTCTYLNDTGKTVYVGDSSDSEMCFVGLYRYPATGAGVFSCSEGPGL
jgi:hypothetical protein